MAKEAEVNFLDASSFSSGLVDDVDMEITAASFEEYDFNGKASNGNACAIHLTLEDDDGEAYEQFYPVGQIEHWQPTDGGAYVEPVGGKKGFSKNSAGAKLIDALIKKGFTGFGERDLGVLVGWKFHWNQVEKEGSEPGEGGRKKTILLPTKFVSKPGGKPAAKGGAAAAKGAKKPPVEEPEEGDSGEGSETLRIVGLVIGDPDKFDLTLPATVDDFGTACFEAAMKDKVLSKDKKARAVVTEQSADEAWLTENASDLVTVKKGKVYAA